MNALLLAVLTASTATAANRGGLSYTGGVAAVSAPQFIPNTTVTPVLACGGMGAVVVPGGAEGTSNRRLLLNTRGCLNDIARYGDLSGGVGGQWGGRALYLTSAAMLGMAYYEQHNGPRMYEALGMSGRMSGALGLQVGGMSLEVGPMASVLLPAITMHTGRPAAERFEGMISLNLTLISGNVSPHP